MVYDIHCCATDPSLWQQTLEHVRCALGATQVAMVENDANLRIAHHSQLPPDSVSSYAAYYYRLDHVIEAVQRGPVGVVRTGAELMWPHAKCEFQSDWGRPNGFEDGLFVRLTNNRHDSTLAIPTRRSRDRFDTRENVALVAALAEHFRQSLRTQEALGRVSAASVFDNARWFRHGLVLVSDSGLVRYANARAEAIFRSAQGLSISRSGIIHTACDADDAALHSAIWTATRSATRTGHSLKCQRQQGLSPLVVHVAPTDSAHALLTIVSTDRPEVVDETLLTDLYGLTPAEARVARMIVIHEGLQTIARELSVSPATVKTHLLSVFRKTGVKRQADLVRLLVSLDPLGSTAPTSEARSVQSTPGEEPQ